MSSSEFLCRLCLEYTDNLIYAFTVIENEYKIADIILQHLQFNVNENDDISNKICTNCWNKLADFHNFYINIQKAQDTITIIESKFNLDEKPILNDITLLDDSVVKTNEHLEFDDNDNDDDYVDSSSIFKEEECHNLNYDICHNNQNEIKDLDIDSDLNTSVNHTVIDDVATKTIRTVTTIIKKVLAKYNEVSDIDASKNNENLKNFDNTEVDNTEEKSTTNNNDDKRNVQDINCVEKSHLKIEKINKRSSSKLATLKKNKKHLSTKQNKNENILSDESYDDADDRDDIPKKKLKKTSVNENAKKSKKHQKNNSVKTQTQTNNNIIIDKYKAKNLIESYYKMKCEICYELTECFEKLFEHYLKSHSIRGFITCCGKKYFKRNLIAEHVLWHKQPDLFKCKICDKLYADRRCLNAHLLMHAPPDMKLYKCDHCPKSFVKKFRLDQHKLCHLTPEEKKYICHECGKPYASDSLLRAHKRVVHDKTYAHMCEICARVFKSRTFFEKHQLEHLGQNLPKLQCKICKAWMKNEHTLRPHMRLHEEANITHECDICGKKGPSRNSILKHKRFVHLSERKFKCTLCSKAFKRAITLKEHMSGHTGEVLYKCTFCLKPFNSGANMHAHRKKAHPIEWEAEKRNKIKLTKPDADDNNMHSI